MDNRLNIGPGPDVRELKLGSTFTNSAPSSVFHTIKCKYCRSQDRIGVGSGPSITFPSWRVYFADDFKPASVDVNKPAVLEVSANKQVTVTVPHLGK